MTTKYEVYRCEYCGTLSAFVVQPWGGTYVPDRCRVALYAEVGNSLERCEGELVAINLKELEAQS